MHIAYLALDYPCASGGGGVGTVVQTLARGLIRHGHEVTVIALASRREPAGCSEDSGVTVIRIRQGSFHWYFSKIPWLGNALARSVRQLERSWNAWIHLRKIHLCNPIDVIEIIEEAGLFTALLLNEPALVARLHGEEYT